MTETEQAYFDTIRLMRDVHGTESARHWGYEQRVPITVIDAALKAPSEPSGDDRFPGVPVGDRMLILMSEEGISRGEIASRIAIEETITVDAAMRMVDGLKGDDDPSLIVVQAYFMALMERQCKTPEELEEFRTQFPPERMFQLSHGLRDHRRQERG